MAARARVFPAWVEEVSDAAVVVLVIAVDVAAASIDDFVDDDSAF